MRDIRPVRNRRRRTLLPFFFLKSYFFFPSLRYLLPRINCTFAQSSARQDALAPSQRFTEERSLFFLI